ncbi:MAG: PHP domain-containing protein [Halobacteriaceae archaeon]
MNYDHHVHSTYSDGELMRRMLDAAADAGLAGVGFADHCNVSERSVMGDTKRRLGFNMDITYERRRAAIEAFRDERDLAIYDAVEMDYEPDDEAAIGAFLDDGDFDYALGSVHHLEDVNIHVADYFARRPERERVALVDEYFEKLVSLIDSELFAVASHPDLIERTPALRGLATEAHYDRVAAAFASSRTHPEVNAGRALREYGTVHPAPAFREALIERDVPVVLGTDAHSPAALKRRVRYLDGFLEGQALETVRPA